jgi:hypothetical protein
MPEMIAALFQERAKAQGALQALVQSGIAPDQIVAAGFNEGRQVSSISGFRALSPGGDFTTELADLHLPQEDLQLFGRGLRRGLTLVAVRVDRSGIGAAVRRLEMFDPVDLDQGSGAWAGTEDETVAADVADPLGTGLAGGATGGLSNTEALPGMGSLTEGADELGTADQRTGEADTAMASTAATRTRPDDEREERPGVNELRTPSAAPAARGGPFQRQLNRGSRVWVYDTGGEGSP